jgi:hypothetical protein
MFIAWDSLAQDRYVVGSTIYAQVVESRGIRIHDAANDDHEPRRAEAETPRTEIGRLLGEWWNGARFHREHHRDSAAAAERKAHERGMRLLIENLSPAQRTQYETQGYFEVTGGRTGNLCRITQDYQMNIFEIGNNGKFRRSLCFAPKGGLVLGDILLAQKFALELFESDALAVANVISGRWATIDLLA